MWSFFYAGDSLLGFEAVLFLGGRKVLLFGRAGMGLINSRVTEPRKLFRRGLYAGMMPRAAEWKKW